MSRRKEGDSSRSPREEDFQTPHDVGASRARRCPWSVVRCPWSLNTSRTIDFDSPEDLDKFQLPTAVAGQLQALLDRQDAAQPLTVAEPEVAEGLVNLAELLTPLRLRAERAMP